MSQQVYLTSAETIQSAYFIQHQLENAGIVSFLRNENITVIAPYIPEQDKVMIYVMEQDYASAKAILADQLMQNDLPVCPSCSSKDVRLESKKGVGKLLLMLTALFVSIVPFVKVKRSYYCCSCRRVFKA